MLAENEKIIDDYFALRKVSPNTQEVYARAMLSWDRIAKIPLSSLGKDTLTSWFKESGKSLGNSTLEKYGIQLRTFYSFTLEQTGLSKNQAKANASDMFDHIPFKDLRRRSKKDVELRDKIVTSAEFNKVMDGATSLRMKALLSMTYETGCRKGEIFSLRLKDIQIHKDHWNLVVEGKTGTRTVPIISSIPYLRAWLTIHPRRTDENSPIFVTSRKGKIQPMNPLSFNMGLRVICKKVGIRMLYPHQLRHTRLTELAENGLGEFQLKSFAGWTAGSNMASRYVHLSGKGHMSAVLKTQGIDQENGERLVDSKPLMELSNCPNCDRPIDTEMVQCPYCQFILDEKMRLNQNDELSDLKAKNDRLEKLLMELSAHVYKTEKEQA
jgi:integrase